MTTRLTPTGFWSTWTTETDNGDLRHSHAHAEIESTPDRFLCGKSQPGRVMDDNPREPGDSDCKTCTRKMRAYEKACGIVPTTDEPHHRYSRY
jgi:hypothetical protein